MLEHVRSGGPELTDSEIATAFLTDQFPPDLQRQLLVLSRETLPGSAVASVRSPDPQVAIVVLERDGRTWDFGVRIEKAPPYRIKNVIRAERTPGVLVRPATEDDAATLREIELKTPIVLGDANVVYDRGEDYFAAERLMGIVLTHVVEIEGRAVGLTSGVIHEVRVKGERMTAAYAHRLRLMPEARGQGMRQMLGLVSFEHESWRSDVPYSFIAASNEAMLRNVRSKWSVRPERIVIDTRSCGEDGAGRAATSADAPRIAALLNAAHEREEMFVPQTVQTLRMRLERQPDLYTWSNVVLGRAAVIGVWPADLNVIRQLGNETTTDRRALVLDYGYDDGGEDELIELLRAACGKLASHGTTELSIFTCEQSSAHSRLRSLAKRVEPYVLNLYIPEPDDLAERGVYVDQLYF